MTVRNSGTVGALVSLLMGCLCTAGVGRGDTALLRGRSSPGDSLGGLVFVLVVEPRLEVGAPEPQVLADLHGAWSPAGDPRPVDAGLGDPDVVGDFVDGQQPFELGLGQWCGHGLQMCGTCRRWHIVCGPLPLLAVLHRLERTIRPRTSQPSAVCAPDDSAVPRTSTGHE